MTGPLHRCSDWFSYELDKPVKKLHCRPNTINKTGSGSRWMWWLNGALFSPAPQTTSCVHTELLICCFKSEPSRKLPAFSSFPDIIITSLYLQAFLCAKLWRRYMTGWCEIAESNQTETEQTTRPKAVMNFDRNICSKSHCELWRSTQLWAGLLSIFYFPLYI